MKELYANVQLLQSEKQPQRPVDQGSPFLAILLSHRKDQYYVDPNCKMKKFYGDSGWFILHITHKNYWDAWPYKLTLNWEWKKWMRKRVGVLLSLSLCACRREIGDLQIYILICTFKKGTEEKGRRKKLSALCLSLLSSWRVNEKQRACEFLCWGELQYL